MEQFKTDKEMLEALDNFIFKSFSLKDSELRMKLMVKINEFLKENSFDGDQHNFVDITKLKEVKFCNKDWRCLHCRTEVNDSNPGIKPTFVCEKYKVALVLDLDTTSIISYSECKEKILY